MKQDATGKVIQAFWYPESAMSRCFFENGPHEAPTFIVPPHSDYWTKIVMGER